MTDLSKLTAKDFSDAMHKGWRKLEWCEFDWWQKNGRTASEPDNATHCCAIGAMARHLKREPMLIADALRRLGLTISITSGEAGNKRAAMKAVDAILLAAPAVRGGE